MKIALEGTPLPCPPAPATPLLNLVKGQRPKLRCLHGTVQNTLQKMQDNAIRWKAASRKA